MSAPAREAEDSIGSFPDGFCKTGSRSNYSNPEDKLKDLDRIFSIIIHQIRNYCMSVKGYASLLAYEDCISEKGNGWLTNINRGISNLEHFISEFDMYRLSRRPKCERIDAGLAVKEAWNALVGTSGRNIALELDIPDDLSIYGDSSDFRKMMFHLLKNALEAVDDKGCISVSFEKESYPVDPAEGWSLEVQDNGCGMTERELSRLYEILFTTKRDHIGCGLSLVASVAERLDADVKVSSKAGVGTIVHIRKREIT